MGDFMKALGRLGNDMWGGISGKQERMDMGWGSA